jgi:hypothetical protein
MTKHFYDDPVVAEIHAIRELLLAQCGGDINEYRKRVLQHQKSSERPVITEPFRNRTEQNVGPDGE